MGWGSSPESFLICISFITLLLPHFKWNSPCNTETFLNFYSSLVQSEKTKDTEDTKELSGLFRDGDIDR